MGLNQVKGEYDIDAPGAVARAVTPNDAADLPNGTARAIYVGVAGDVTMTLARDGAQVLFKSMAVGLHPLRAKRIWAAGTTATDIVAIY